MVWGACGFGAPTGQTIRWQLELLLLKPHLSRGFQLYTGPVIFWFESQEEARALAVVWEEAYVVQQEVSTFCIPGSAAPMWSLCPSQALMVSGLLTGVSHNEPCAHPEHFEVVSGLLWISCRWKFLPLVGKCFSLSVRVGQTPWRKSFDFGENIYISLGFSFFFP